MADSTALYIDDDRKEAEGYIARLNKAGSLRVEYAAPPINMDVSKYPNAELYLVDYALDESPVENDTRVGYQGQTFAMHLRDRFPDKPIALITKKPLYDERRRSAYLESLHLFNADFPKTDMLRDTATVVRRAEALVKGFDTLRKVSKDWKGLLEALGATSDEARLLGATVPPLRLESEKEGDVVKRKSFVVGENWKVADVALWLQEVVLRYPGILYDSLHAATFLGITEEEFLAPDVQEFFNEVAYTGALSPPDGRWWRGRITSAALKIVQGEESISASINRSFANAFSKACGRTLEQCRCNSSNLVPADWVCYVLRQPVRLEYSLVYHPDNRPSVMDDARVSFKAIRESNDVFDELFDPSSLQLIDGIRADHR